MGYETSVKAVLNFAADRNDGGRFSSSTGEKAQALLPVEVEIRNIRTLAHAPTLEEEGFAICAHPVEAPRWDDPAWIETVYVPSCLALIAKLTGARATVHMYNPITRTRHPDGKAAAAADFIHLDQPRDQYRGDAEKAAAAQGITLGRAAIYNVWKAITPPPQDLPLTLADRRTVAAADHVIGTSFGSYGEAHHVKIAHGTESAPAWYYVPDLELDESIVFLSADFDPDRPLGCPHSAFSPPPVEGGYAPRTSVEVRVLACFD